LFGKKGLLFHTILQAICFKESVENLNSYQKIVRQKGIFFHPIVRVVGFKKPVESLLSCQTIVRQKRLIFPYYFTGKMLQKVCGKFDFLSKNCSSKRHIFPSYCTGNMLQKACGKFDFLSNNCSAKRLTFPYYCKGNMILIVCGKLEFLSKNCSAKKAYSSFLHPIVQAICFRKPVEILNSCQTIVRQKMRIFPYYCKGNMLLIACGKLEFLSNNCSAKKAYFSIEQTVFKKIDCGSKQFVKHLTARIKNFV
jgi:hypothetical protein